MKEEPKFYWYQSKTVWFSILYAVAFAAAIHYLLFS